MTELLNKIVADSNKYFLKAKDELTLGKRQEYLENSLKGFEEAYTLIHKIDKLDPLSKFKLEFNLASVYALLSNEKAKFYLGRLRKTLNIITINSNIKRQIGLLYLKLGNDLRNYSVKLYEALTCYKYAAHYLSDSRNLFDMNLRCQILVTIANLSDYYENQNDDGQFETILDACNSINDNYLKAKIYSDVASSYAKFSKKGKYFQQSVNLFMKSAKILETLANKGVHSDANISKAQVYINMGALCNRYGKYEDGLKYTQNSIEILEKENGDGKDHLSDAYYNLGLVFAKMKNFKEAKNALNDSLKTSKDVGKSGNNKIDCLIALGEISITTAEDDVALRYFQDALELHRKSQNEDDEKFYDIERKIKKKISLTQKFTNLKKNIRNTFINETPIVKTFNGDKYSQNNFDDINLNDHINKSKSKNAYKYVNESKNIKNDRNVLDDFGKNDTKGKISKASVSNWFQSQTNVKNKIVDNNAEYSATVEYNDSIIETDEELQDKIQRQKKWRRSEEIEIEID